MKLDLRLGASPRLARCAALPLRLMIGCGMAAHGYANLARGPSHFVALVRAVGVPAADLLGRTTIAVEFVGGMAILLGALVPLVSIPIAAVLLFAMFIAHLPCGFSSIKLQSVSAAGAATSGQPGYPRLRSRPPVSGLPGGARPRRSGPLLGRRVALRAPRRQVAPMMRAVVVAVALLSVTSSAEVAPPSKARFKAVAVDYFVLFDPISVVPEVEKIWQGGRIHEGLADQLVRIRISALDHEASPRLLRRHRRARLHRAGHEPPFDGGIARATPRRVSDAEAVA